MLRQASAIGNVEAQVVPLEGRRVLVEMDENDKDHGVLDGDGDVGSSRHRHPQPRAVHQGTLVAGQDQPVLSIHDDTVRCDLQVRPSGLVGQDGQSAKVGALLLVAGGWRWCPDELPVHRHAWKAEAGA